jgi:hypothetical protein
MKIPQAVCCVKMWRFSDISATNSVPSAVWDQTTGTHWRSGRSWFPKHHKNLPILTWPFARENLNEFWCRKGFKTSISCVPIFSCGNNFFVMLDSCQFQTDSGMQNDYLIYVFWFLWWLTEIQCFCFTPFCLLWLITIPVRLKNHLLHAVTAVQWQH